MLAAVPTRGAEWMLRVLGFMQDTLRVALGADTASAAGDGAKASLTTGWAAADGAHLTLGSLARGFGAGFGAGLCLRSSCLLLGWLRLHLLLLSLRKPVLLVVGNCDRL